MCELVCQIVQKKQEEKRIEEEQAASARYWKIPACCDDDDDYDSAITPILSTEEHIDSLSMWDEHLDIILATKSDEPPIFYDDEESSIPLRDIISELLLSVAIAPGFLIMDILIMEDEHLDTILETKSNKVIKSSVENLVPIPSESTDLTDYEKELNSEISDAIIESFSPSPIPVENCDSLMGEIDIFLAMDGSIPPGIENDDYDLEGDVLFLNNYLTMILFPFPKVVDDIFDNLTRELYVHVPNVLPTLPTLYPVFDTLPPFSFENEDKVFNPGIIASKVEKSPHLLSHRGFKAFKLIFFTFLKAR
nr:hypothetical protein [Tanacetum cinerariifolium]